MSLTLLDGLSNQTLDVVLEDLLARFLINVPSEDLASVERVFFQVEEAHWFYSDYARVLNPSLPNLKIKPFASRLLALAPLIWRWGDPNDALARFGKYKSTIPVRGLALFSPDLSKVLLVKGTDSNSWSFPRGKISKGESDVDCAVREALEETGFNAAGLVNENDYIERTMMGKNYKIFMAKNVPLDYPFAPLARFEIAKIEWHDIKLLAKRAKASANQYFIVSAMIKPMLKWIEKQKGSEQNLLRDAEHRLKLLLGIFKPEASELALSRSEKLPIPEAPNSGAPPPPNFSPYRAAPPPGGVFPPGVPPPPSFFSHGVPPPNFFSHDSPAPPSIPGANAPAYESNVSQQDSHRLLNILHHNIQEVHPSPRPDQLRKPLAATHDFLSILTSKDRVAQNERELRNPHDSSTMDSLKQRALESDLPAHFIKLLNKKKEKKDAVEPEKNSPLFAETPTVSHLNSPALNDSNTTSPQAQYKNIPLALDLASPQLNTSQVSGSALTQGNSTFPQVNAQAGSRQASYSQSYMQPEIQALPSNEIEQSMSRNRNVLPDKKVTLLKRQDSPMTSDQPALVDKLASRSLLGLLNEPSRASPRKPSQSHAHAQDLMSMLRKKDPAPVSTPVSAPVPAPAPAPISPPSPEIAPPSVSSHMLPEFDNFETFEAFEADGSAAPPAYRNFDVASDDEDVDHLVDGINNTGLAIPPAFHTQPESQKRPIRLLRHGEAFPDAVGSPGQTQANPVPAAHVPVQNTNRQSAGQNLLAMLQRPPVRETPQDPPMPPATNSAGKDLMNVLFGRN